MTGEYHTTLPDPYYGNTTLPAEYMDYKDDFWFFERYPISQMRVKVIKAIILEELEYT